MWQKLTWMLFRQKSTREVLRKLWGCWFISGSMQSVLFEILSTSLSLSPSGPPPSLHPPTPSGNTDTHRRRQKSLWAWPVPSVNDILFTNTLNSVAGVMVAHTLALSVWGLYLIPLFKWPLTSWGSQFGWILRMNGAHLATLCNVEKTHAWNHPATYTHTQTIAIIIIPKPPSEGKMCCYPKGKFTVQLHIRM